MGPLPIPKCPSHHMGAVASHLPLGLQGQHCMLLHERCRMSCVNPWAVSCVVAWSFVVLVAMFLVGMGVGVSVQHAAVGVTWQ